MYINEVIKITGLSRKALAYYEEKGLVIPSRQDNGYRTYDKEDVENLQKISLLKDLDLNISEIKDFMTNQKISSSLLRERQERIERSIKQNDLIKKIIDGYEVSEIEVEIKKLERNLTIYDRLTRIFPGYFGQAIFASYKPFLETILNDDNNKSFERYINYLDSLEEIPFSEEEKKYIENISRDIDKECLDDINQKKIAAIDDYQKWTEDNEEFIKAYKEYLESDDYKKSLGKTIREKIEKYFRDNNYYEIAIPLIRDFAPKYDAYYKKLLEIDTFNL